MVNQIDWNGARLEVRCWALARKLWLTCSIDVYVDDRCVLRTGGKFKNVGSHSAQFTRDNATHTVELTWGDFENGAFPCSLRVDGETVGEPSVGIENKWQSKIGCFLVVALAIAVAYRACAG